MLTFCTATPEALQFLHYHQHSSTDVHAVYNMPATTPSTRCTLTHMLVTSQSMPSYTSPTKEIRCGPTYALQSLHPKEHVSLLSTTFKPKLTHQPTQLHIPQLAVMPPAYKVPLHQWLTCQGHHHHLTFPTTFKATTRPSNHHHQASTPTTTTSTTSHMAMLPTCQSLRNPPTKRLSSYQRGQ